MSPILNCPALLISATASAQGKTTITAALAWHFRQQGMNVQVFKTGPDFLDPKILEVASGRPVYQLDLWMVGEDQCRQLLYRAAKGVDLILIEGVMGLFDGQPSSAELAKYFAIPVLAVIDASAMAGTFAAIAHGLSSFDKNLSLAGVLANRVGSDAHGNMLRDTLPPHIKWFGALKQQNDISLPERHLGLYSANEISDLHQRLEHASRILTHSGLGDLASFTRVTFKATENSPTPPPLLKNVRIGIARDAAFCFCYPANLDLLADLGASLVYFSPMSDTELPPIDSLYLPGGYPELHLQTLQNNRAMKNAIRHHFESNKPIVAECGGLLYLMDSITDSAGNSAQMTGILAGKAEMQTRWVNLSMQRIKLTAGEIRGHSFHYSVIHDTIKPSDTSIVNGKYGQPEAVYRTKRLFASYMHLYMPSSPLATAEIFSPA